LAALEQKKLSRLESRGFDSWSVWHGEKALKEVVCEGVRLGRVHDDVGAVNIQI